MAHKIEKSADGQTIVIIIQDKQEPRRRGRCEAGCWGAHRGFLDQDHHSGPAAGDIAVLTDGRY